MNLDTSLTRVRANAGSPGGDFILVHGPIAAGEAPWLWRYCSAKVSTDPELALFVSSRVPSLFGVSPGVAFHNLNGPPLAILVEPPANNEAGLSSAPSPLDLVVSLLGQGLRVRADQKLAAAGKAAEQGDRTSMLPDHTMAAVIDDLPALLLEHPLTDVLVALKEANEGVKGARCSPVVLCLDTRAVDSSVFTALSSMSSLVIRLDEPPRLAVGGGALGHQQGTLVFTETLSSGKTRSFRQDYQVQSNGAFSLGAVAVAPSAAALMTGAQVAVSASAAAAASTAAAKAASAASLSVAESSSLGGAAATPVSPAISTAVTVGSVTLHSHRGSSSSSDHQSGSSGGSSSSARDPLPQLNSSSQHQPPQHKPLVFSAAGATKPGTSLRKLADAEGVGGAGGYDDDADEDEGGPADLDDDLDL